MRSRYISTACQIHDRTSVAENAAADLAPPVATRPLVPHDPATPPARWLPYSGTGCGPRPVVRGRVWPPARREDHANSAYIRPARRLVIEATVNL
jgi:hypothetical protein